MTSTIHGKLLSTGSWVGRSELKPELSHLLPGNLEEASAQDVDNATLPAGWLKEQSSLQ